MGSPEINNPDPSENQIVKVTVSEAKLKAIIDRLTNYDPQIGPPHSTTNRVHLGYGRYEYPGRTSVVVRIHKAKKVKVRNVFEI